MTSFPLPYGSVDASVISQYVNGVRVYRSQWDLTLDFSLSGPAPDALEEEPGPEGVQPVMTQRVARLVMSPMHAKAMAEIIEVEVRHWEEQYGQLPAGSRLLANEPTQVLDGEPIQENGRSDD